MFIVKHAQQFKGPSRRKFRTLSTKTAFKCHTLKVKCYKMLVPGMSKSLIHHDNHNLKQATGVSTHILPNFSFKVTVSSHLIICNPWRSQILSQYSVDPEIYSWSKDQLSSNLLMVSPSPSKQVLKLYLNNTVCLPPFTSTLFTHSQIPIQQMQILSWRLGLVAGYITQHCNVALELTSRSEFALINRFIQTECMLVSQYQ